MESIRRAVKLVFRDAELNNVLKSVYSCGTIESMYLDPEVKEDHQQLFVLFAKEQSVVHSLALPQDIFKIFGIGENSILRDEFLATRKQANLVYGTKAESPTLLGPATLSAQRRDALLLPVNTNQPFQSTPLVLSSTNKPSKKSTEALRISDGGPSRTLPHETLSSAYTAASHVGLALNGEKFSLDLKLLGTACEGVIELLRTTRCATGTWMTVAAHYRREGKPQSALGVLNAMLQARHELDITATQLNPIYLMLSGCETDLAKRAKADKITLEQAEKHYARARDWLQKVYGKHSLKPLSGNDNATIDTQPTLKISKTPPASPATKTSCTHDKENAPLNPLRSPYKSPNIRISRSPYSRERFLEREVEALRENNRKTTISLEDLRDCKRRLEDDLAFERDKRRKLEYILELTEEERDVARRKEGYALEEARREAIARHRAEDRIAISMSPTRNLYREGR